MGLLQEASPEEMKELLGVKAGTTVTHNHIPNIIFLDRDARW